MDLGSPCVDYRAALQGDHILNFVGGLGTELIMGNRMGRSVMGFLFKLRKAKNMAQECGGACCRYCADNEICICNLLFLLPLFLQNILNKRVE